MESSKVAVFCDSSLFLLHFFLEPQHPQKNPLGRFSNSPQEMDAEIPGVDVSQEQWITREFQTKNLSMWRSWSGKHMKSHEKRGHLIGYRVYIYIYLRDDMHVI